MLSCYQYFILLVNGNQCKNLNWQYCMYLEVLLTTYHTCGGPELLPDCLDLTWRKQKAVTPGVRKLHCEGVGDLSSVLKKEFVNSTCSY